MFFMALWTSSFAAETPRRLYLSGILVLQFLVFWEWKLECKNTNFLLIVEKNVFLYSVSSGNSCCMALLYSLLFSGACSAYFVVTLFEVLQRSSSSLLLLFNSITK